MGTGGKAPSLGCFYSYIGGCRGISASFILPTRAPGSCCWVVGRVSLNLLLIFTPKSRVTLVIFKGKHRKNNAELLSSFNELCAVRGAIGFSASHLHIVCGEGRQPSLSTTSTYFIHIFVNFSANKSFAQVFIDNHTKSKSYFNDF